MSRILRLKPARKPKITILVRKSPVINFQSISSNMLYGCML